MKFHIGQKVVCVAKSWSVEVDVMPPVKPLAGKAYTVSGYSALHPTHLLLAEIPIEQDGWMCVWDEKKFEPLIELTAHEENIIKELIEESIELKNRSMNEEGEYWSGHRAEMQERKHKLAERNEKVLTDVCAPLGIVAVKVTSATWKITKGGNLMLLVELGVESR